MQMKKNGKKRFRKILPIVDPQGPAQVRPGSTFIPFVLSLLFPT